MVNVNIQSVAVVRFNMATKCKSIGLFCLIYVKGNSISVLYLY